MRNESERNVSTAVTVISAPGVCLKAATPPLPDQHLSFAMKYTKQKQGMSRVGGKGGFNPPGST